MNIKFDSATLYMSHPIRGSNNDIEGNCKKAKRAAEKLRRVFPEVDFYVPAENDLTLQILTHHKKLNIDDIMFADLTILEACSGWFYYQFDSSEGSEEEKRFAQDIGLTVGNTDVINFDIEKANYSVIRDVFTPIVEVAKERFRRS